MGKQKTIPGTERKDDVDRDLEVACADLDVKSAVESEAREVAGRARARVMELLTKKDRVSYTLADGSARFDVVTTPEKVKVAIKRLEVTHEDATDEAAEE